jgi:lysozyme
VFFLKTEKFDDEQERTEEVKQFLELVALLNYLNRSGYITIYRDKTEKMYFIQDGFNNARIQNNNIILNARGDYSSAPDTIHDSRKNIIYKGIVFKTDTYNLILSSTAGNLLVSESLKSLLNEGATPPSAGEPQKANAAGKKRTRTSAINIITFILSGLMLLALISGGILAGFKAKEHDKFFYNINSSLRQLSDTVDAVSSAIERVHLDLTDLKTADSSQMPCFGIDISKWNGNEVSDIKGKDSITFIICKATEGIGFIDPDLKSNWEMIRSGDYILGAYHFYHVTDDPLKQADHFFTTINGFGETDIAPVVDIEQASLPKDARVSLGDIHKKLLLFLDALEKKSGRVPVIYTDAVFADTYLLNELFGKYPLWLAEYTGASKPRIPKTWETKGYMIWQKSDNYYIDTRTSDYDVFKGPKSKLTQ